MKKVLALVLAFVMVAGLATVAMAAESLTTEPGIVTGQVYKISSKGVITEAGAIQPGDTIYYSIADVDANVKLDKDVKTMDYNKIKIVETVENTKVLDSVKVVTKKLTDVSAVAGHGFTADHTYYFVQVSLKDNMSIEDQELEIVVSLPASNVKGESSVEVTINPAIAYGTAEVSSLFGLNTGKFVVSAEDETEDDWTEVDMFLGENDAHFVSKMYKQGDFYIAVDEDAQDKYEELYGDEAAMDYLWVTMPKGLKQAGTLYIPAAMVEEDKAPYLYEEKDGKLVEIKNAYDEENEEFVLKNIKTIGKYVISDIELDVADSVDGDATEENPATGANDVVAIAAGLAVVSLVAAGAVSLKK